MGHKWAELAFPLENGANLYLRYPAGEITATDAARFARFVSALPLPDEQCPECRGEGGWHESDDELNRYWIVCPSCGPAGRSEPSSSSGVTGYQATSRVSHTDEEGE